ncbi:hypothetical protein SAY86_029195 [Trapa natans]|uniref:Auxin-responsive protein n=1 Tax=Trapa natans TaxID=22666 RepID=A0AAN7M1T1_TRANT|nr:hypothetical protein SAY86_029195 [Trapa natans]
MHIGILAAAAHAATNQSSFTIFYNPRACPSEFVVPLVKYRKAVYGTRISVGMRFGMMFETEESGKRRYMGTIIGLSDLDPLRWPGSKWRNLQVEWDEPGCLDKQNRVSTWEVETPESLFIFPSLTSGLKRPFSAAETDWGNLIKRPLMQFPENGHGRGTFLPYSPVPNLCSEQLIKMILKPPQMGAFPLPRDVDSKVPVPLQEFNYNMSDIVNKKQDQSSTVCSSPQVVGGAAKEESPSKAETQVLEAEKLKLDPEYKIGPGLMNQMLPVGECNGENLWACLLNQQNNHICPPPTFINQNQAPIILQPNSSPATQAINVVQTDQDGLQGSSSLLNAEEWMVNPVIPQSLAGLMRSQSSPSVLSMQDQSPSFIDPMAQILPSMGAEIWDPTGNLQYLSQVDQLTPLPEQDPSSLCCISNSVSVRDLSDESNNESGIYNCLKGGSYIVDPSVSSAILDEFCSMKDVRFQNPSDCMVGGTFSSSQDVQSQITSASLVDVQPLPPRDLRDSSGVTSSSNVDFDDNSLLKNNCSWQQVAPLPPMRTYTKVQKAGSVGRSIDVTNFKNYEELLSAIECMFGLEGVLNDPRGSGWKLVYVDYENDVLLVGDDPWEEFVGCVRCIRILSPAEVQQMSEEGMELLNSAAAQGLNGGRACFIR